MRTPLGPQSWLIDRPIIVLVGGLLIAFSSEALGANLGNVMPLGDSITVGVGDGAGGGYRDPLYTRLTEAGHAFQFVGTASDWATTLLSDNGQRNHEGHSGYVIEAGSSGRQGIRDNIATYLGATTPDLILLMIGTNDIDHGYQLATAPDRLSDLLTDIDALAPNAHTIVANLVPVKSQRGPLTGRVESYNASVRGVVASHLGPWTQR